MSEVPVTPAPSPSARVLGLVGAGWGVLGVSVLLLGGVISMGRYVLDLVLADLTGGQLAALVVFLVIMIVGKGYFGLHRGFSPRAAARAHTIAREPSLLRVLLAPLFSMSLFQAPTGRLLRSWGLTLTIACLVPIIRVLPWPWRGIVDAGVVAGLSVGLVSFWWYALVRPVVMGPPAPRSSP